jgi:hypothetical protein
MAKDEKQGFDLCRITLCSMGGMGVGPWDCLGAVRHKYLTSGIEINDNLGM